MSQIKYEPISTTRYIPTTSMSYVIEQLQASTRFMVPTSHYNKSHTVCIIARISREMDHKYYFKVSNDERRAIIRGQRVNGLFTNVNK